MHVYWCIVHDCVVLHFVYCVLCSCVIMCVGLYVCSCIRVGVRMLCGVFLTAVEWYGVYGGGVCVCDHQWLCYVIVYMCYMDVNTLN